MNLLGPTGADYPLQPLPGCGLLWRPRATRPIGDGGQPQESRAGVWLPGHVPGRFSTGGLVHLRLARREGCAAFGRPWHRMRPAGVDNRQSDPVQLRAPVHPEATAPPP